MSGPAYEELILLNRKLDDLLNRYSRLRTGYEEINNRNQTLERMLWERDEKIKELETKYERVKISGALLGEGESADEAKKKITELVREIDRCVALLNR